MKANFHEKNFDNLATPREVVLNLHSAITEAFAKSLKTGGNISVVIPGAPLTYFNDGEVRRIFWGLTFWPKGIFLGL